jgi:hypothetical protein
MPAIELRQDEIGFYDPEAAKARRERLWGKPKPVVVKMPPRREPDPVAAVERPVPRVRVIRAHNAETPVEAPVMPELPEPAKLVDAIVQREIVTARDWLNVASILGSQRVPERPHLRRRIQAREIVAIVARVYDIPVLDIKSARRTANVVRPRQEAMWLCRNFTLLSLPEIGRQFGGRDHTTVLHAIKKIEDLISEWGYEARALPFVQDLQDRLNAQADAASAAIAAE